MFFHKAHADTRLHDIRSLATLRIVWVTQQSIKSEKQMYAICIYTI